MRFLILALLLSASTAFAQTPIAPVFESSFNSNYQSGQCGTNIMNLVKLANEEGVDLSNARVILITNESYFNFGMVGGFEARSSRLDKTTGKRIPYFELRSWYHHVFLEHDGYIYDYDFGSEPRVTPVAEYVERMFLPEKRWSLGDKITSREDRLKGYRVEIRTAESTLQRSQEKGELMTLGEFLAR
ncbi:MAG: hypothetical protein EOP05_19800 [Proteobacteria bacterium]|nr:MAG: hypothetical protein EOP05_19800 [Pseudomonadota bacterium]